MILTKQCILNARDGIGQETMGGLPYGMCASLKEAGSIKIIALPAIDFSGIVWLEIY